MKEKLKKIDLSNASALIVLIVLCIGLTIAEPAFGSVANLINILQQVTVIAVLALGVNVVIFTGGIDISVGSVVAFTGIVMGKLIVENGMPDIVGVIAAVLVGAACGTFNGIMISKFKLQPMIATLAMMSMARGAAYTLADGQTITGYSAGFRWIGIANIPGTAIPVQIVFMVLLYIAFYYVMKYRKFGRYIYSIGGNEEATRLSGINVNRVKLGVYALMGAVVAIAAVLQVSRIGAMDPANAGSGYELDSIAAVIVGGTSMSGGKGSVVGTVFGMLIIAVMNNLLNLLGVPPFLREAFKGAIIIAAVLLQRKSSDN